MMKSFLMERMMMTIHKMRISSFLPISSFFSSYFPSFIPFVIPLFLPSFLFLNFFLSGNCLIFLASYIKEYLSLILEFLHFIKWSRFLIRFRISYGAGGKSVAMAKLLEDITILLMYSKQ
jgi:hypothetical protein